MPATRDLGDAFKVRRALPSARRRTIGPFVFLDEMGPARFEAGTGLDVRPHPHIGLATLTYLFDGEILHQDSLGTRQPIRPGDVNWMIAGRGIVHSERTPGFTHHGKDALPFASDRGTEVRVVAGSFLGMRSPVPVLSECFYADATLEAGSVLAVPADQDERAAYVVAGSVSVDGQAHERGRLLVFKPATQAVITALSPARLVVLGGQTLSLAA